jgi:hypothetical protein
MRERVVACHQPNFLPWLGFFAKMARADVFVLLDDVQFTRGANKHNWTTRVRILGSNGPLWLSLPVRRSGTGLQRIADLRTDERDARWLAKMLATLEQSYGKAPHAGKVLPPLLDILQRHAGSICETNVAMIDAVASLIAPATHRVRSSTLQVEGTGTARLVNLTKACGGGVYLSGDGADDYQLKAGFSAAGITLRKLGFHHPTYPQCPRAPFQAGLSAVDALCHAGVEATRTMLLAQPAAAHA